MKMMIAFGMALLCLGCSPSAQSEQSQNIKNINNSEIQAASSQSNRETMQITIGTTPFTVELAGNATSEKLQMLLPLTLSMEDHLHNEKHAQLPQSLPVDSYAPRQVQAGDVMLWGNNTLVIFYENFTSSYSYTRIGKIQNASQLKEVVGRDTVQVNFTLNK